MNYDFSLGVDTSPSIPRALIILPNNPGDVLMALQAIQSVWSEAIASQSIEIHYLVDSEAQSLVEGSPIITKTWVQPRSQVVQLWNDSTPQATQDLVREFFSELCSINFDLSVNLFQAKSGALIQSLVRAKLKRGPIINQEGVQVIEDPWTAYLHAIPAHRKANPYHTVDVYRRILRPLLFEQNQLPSTGPSKLQLPSYAAFEWPRPYICFQVGSAWPGKKWPLKHWDKFLKLIQNSQEVQAYDLLFIGAPSEFEEVESLIQARPNCFNLCGKTSLIDVAGILENCQLLMCPDTFAMHMGASLKIPVLALFGPSVSTETGPWCENQFIYSSLCEHPQTLDFVQSQEMNQLHPKDVFKLFIPLLKHPFEKLNIDFNSQMTLLSKTSWNPDQSLLEHKSKSCPPASIVSPWYPDVRKISSWTLDLMLEQITAISYLLAHQDWSGAIEDIEAREDEINQSCLNSITLEQYRIELNGLSLRLGVAHFMNKRKQLLEKYHKLIQSLQT